MRIELKKNKAANMRNQKEQQTSSVTVKHAGPYATFGSWSLQTAACGKQGEVARSRLPPGCGTRGSAGATARSCSGDRGTFGLTRGAPLRAKIVAQAQTNISRPPVLGSEVRCCVSACVSPQSRRLCCGVEMCPFSLGACVSVCVCVCVCVPTRVRGAHTHA